MNKYVNLPKRDVAGVLLIDKPKNISSSFLLNKIKRIFHANKAGHTGTLDVLATGMLPICFGKATKLARYLLNFDKKYRVVARLGISTNTFDAKGRITRVTSVKLDLNKLEQCLESFRGRFYQIPPMFSSVKYCGMPLYKYACKNIEITRCAREIYVYNLNVIMKDIDMIELIVHCSKGVYIRSIINDLGQCLGCGAYVLELRRLSVGNFLSSSMVKIKTLENIFYSSSLSDRETLKQLDTLLLSIDIIKSLC